MFGIEHFFMFLTAGLLLNITPGPDMLYVATRSSTQGKKAGLVSALGIGTGAFVHILAASFGLSAIIFYSSIAFEVIKWCGALYLIWLGVQAILEARQENESTSLALETGGQRSLWQIYRKGILVNLLNPKVALFFLAFIPQFIDTSSTYATAQILFLGTLFDLTGTLINIIVAYGFGTLGSWLQGNPVFHKVKSWFSGTVYILMGIGVALSERR